MSRALVILSHLEFYYVFNKMKTNNATRKYKINADLLNLYNFLYRFDGNTNFIINTKSSSNYPHRWILTMGSYKGLPFVTGSFLPHNKKTEIYEFDDWRGAEDYPYNDGEE